MKRLQNSFALSAGIVSHKRGFEITGQHFRETPPCGKGVHCRNLVCNFLRGKENPNNKNSQFWLQDNPPEELITNEFIDQKLNYMHNNPVQAGLVAEPEHYRYSSAVDYAGRKGIVECDAHRIEQTDARSRIPYVRDCLSIVSSLPSEDLTQPRACNSVGHSRDVREGRALQNIISHDASAQKAFVAF